MRSHAKRIVLIPVLLALVTSAAACSGSNDDPTGVTWQLTELEGAPPIDGTTIDMTITGDEVSGTAGCNSYSGPVEVNVDDNTMTFGAEIISTMMACGDEVDEQERRYLNALTMVTSYEMANDTLTLMDANGVAVAMFDS